LGDDSFALSFAPVDGKFPDLRRIVPRLKSTEIEAHQFNPDLAVRCRDALRLVIGSRSQQAHIDHSFGGKSMLVTMPKTTAFCVLAGLRGADPSPICTLPDYGA